MENQLDSSKLIEHLFRRESGKMVSVISRVLGFSDLDSAEDIVSETMLKATSHWAYKGIPENPAGWLYTTAKNKAIDVIRKKKNFQNIEQEYKESIAFDTNQELGEIFQDELIEDSQLKMIFSCCHPELNEKEQICLILKTLCGFSAKEISKATLSAVETVNKRIFRCKDKIRKNNIDLVLPDGEELQKRLQTVIKIVYIIFNEGYFSDTNEDIIRRDMCFEAMRLCKIITDRADFKTNDALALNAIMCFNVARFDARTSSSGNLISLRDQDRLLWNGELVNQGFKNLMKIDEGYISTYVIEAAIAANHISAAKYEETNWTNIIKLYDLHLEYQFSEQVILNRGIAKIENGDWEGGEKDLLSINTGTRHLEASLAYLYIKKGNLAKASKHKANSLKEAKTNSEKAYLNNFLKLDVLID